jgi:signal peptidase II
VSDDVPSSSSGTASGPRTAHPLAVKVGVIVTLALMVLDQATKELAEAVLAPGEFVPWLAEGIGWQLIYNPGGAFGLPAPSWLFLAVTVVVLVLVARALPQATSLTAAVAFGMLLAGALGNALDRVLRPGDPDTAFGGGYVVDFVAWGSFPRFNVADSAITVGFVLLVIALWIEERRGDESEVAADPRAGREGEAGSAR